MAVVNRLHLERVIFYKVAATEVRLGYVRERAELNHPPRCIHEERLALLVAADAFCVAVDGPCSQQHRR